MFTIQQKLLCYTILITFVPLSIAGVFFYNQTIENTKNNLMQSTLETFEQIDNSIFLKKNRIEKALNLVVSNKYVHEILRNTDFNMSDAASFRAAKELDSVFSMMCAAAEEIRGVILFSSKGGVYTYRCSWNDTSVVSFAMKYGKVDETQGKLTWLGTPENNDFSGGATVDLIGTVLCDTSYIKDNKTLSTIYLLVEDNYFTSSIKDVDTASLMIYDDIGKPVVSKGKQKLANIWNVSLEAGQKIFSNDKGDFQINIDDEEYYLNFYKSPSTEWTYVRMVLYREYFKEFRNISYSMLLIVLFVIGISFVVNIYFVKRVTMPIKEVVYAMSEVGKRNFDITMNTYSNDEFGVISDGFNTMVSQLNELFIQIEDEAEKRRHADIMALQYQMTPHFLYNTLSSIRLNSYSKGEYETSEMLLIMGRFLRSVINNAGRMVRVDDEIQNIEDYISLYKIRHENKFSSLCEVEDDIKECKIPAMMIQPLVENAIFHGLNQKLDGVYPAMVKVTIAHKGEDIHITILDNGVGIAEGRIKELNSKKDTYDRERMHIGISNIRTRIYDLFGDNYGLKIESVQGEYTFVEITLPLIKDESIENVFEREAVHA